MRLIWLILSIAVFLALQSALAGRMAFGRIEPDFVVMCVVLLGLQRGPVQGALFGFVIGLIVDLANPGSLGLNALANTLVGFGTGRIGAATSTGWVILAIVFFMATLAHDVVYYLVYLWPRVGGALYSVITTALPSAVYTAIVGLGVQVILALLGAKLVTPLGKTRR
jgi:rod shape-determining protein MreD